MKLVRIQIVEEDKVAGFYILLNQTFALLCLNDEIYYADERVLKRLDERGIKYKTIERKKEVTLNE